MTARSHNHTNRQACKRGEHIHDARDGRAPHDLSSVTVVGPSLTWADAYATTAFAMGTEGPAGR